MISDENKNYYINKITSSGVFNNSDILKDLLVYLFEKSISNEIPKATTISFELYQNKNFDPSIDSYVRFII